MPEGIEVRITAEQLDSSLRGSSLLAYYPSPDPLPEKKISGFNEVNFPRQIRRIFPYGKKIIFELDNGYLMSALGMTGRWSHSRSRDTRLSLVYSLSTEIKFLFYDDIRKFGSLQYLTAIQLQGELSKLGPDVLNTQITFEMFMSRFLIANSHRRCKQVITKFLLEQSYFSGIGNYLKSEILYYARVDPHLRVNELTDEEFVRIYQAIPYVLQLSYRNGGLTIKDYLPPSNQHGTYPCAVYGKTLDPYNNPVEKYVECDRPTFWAPAVQARR